MNIGLVRHCKVNCATKMFMTSYDFENIKWHKCLSSDLYRAVRTAEAIFEGEILKTNLLREVCIYPIFKSNIKLPYIFWCISGRVAWLFKHKSQIETIENTKERVKEFLDTIQNESDINILIVCHEFFMKSLQKELKGRGFCGKSIKRPQNGTLYLYKK